MNGRHYCDYNPGKLQSQEALSSYLDLISKGSLIEDSIVNAMTIRLLITKDGLTEIVNFCANIHGGLRKSTDTITNLKILGGVPFLDVMTQTVSGSNVATHAIKVPQTTTPVVAGLHDPQSGAHYSYQLHGGEHWYVASNDSINTFVLHRGLYQFFMNYVSALDRLAFEINKLLPGVNVRHFSELTNRSSNPQPVAYMRANGLVALANLTTSTQADEVMQANTYRNRIAHDGIVKIEIGGLTGEINLPDNPNAPTPNFNIRVDTFCNDRFNKLIDLIDRIYAQLQIDVH